MARSADSRTRTLTIAARVRSTCDHAVGVGFERNLYAWDPDKPIIRWAWTRHAKYRERFASAMTSSALDHIRFIRLRSHAETERWLASLRTEEH